MREIHQTGVRITMKIGYLSIPKGEQITTQQEEDALAALPCDKIFRDVTSREKDDRPEFLRMLARAQPGDCIVVWRLDRLGRSLRHLIDTSSCKCTKCTKCTKLKLIKKTKLRQDRFSLLHQHVIYAL